MNFLVKDLIKPNLRPPLEKFNFHSKYSKSFQNLSLDNPLYDTIFYGASGSGKFTLLMACLQRFYGPKVLKLTPIWDGSDEKKKKGKSNIEFTIESVGSVYGNEYLTLINPTVKDTMKDDKIVEYLKSQIDIEGTKHHYLVIVHLERLKQSTLNYLKWFIEKRKNYLYVLATCSSNPQLSQGLKGLFTMYRVSRPSLDKVTKYFLKIIPQKFQKGNIITKDKIKKVYKETAGDLKLIINYLNQYLLAGIDPTLKKKHPNTFRAYLCTLINFAVKGDIKDLNMIRSMIQTIYRAPFTWDEYTHYFMGLISMSKLKDNQKIEITKIVADTDYQVRLSKVNYCHYEAIIFQLMEILHG